MKQTDYEALIQVTSVGGGWIPANEAASELLDKCHKGEVLTFKEVTARDINMHRCYMDLIGIIYDYLPKHFQERIPKNKFYIWLKHLKKDYKVVYEFKDGTKMIEYDSLAFGNMSQKRFETFVAEQLPFIYENVIGAFFEGKIYEGILYNIERDYQTFLRKLN